MRHPEWIKTKSTGSHGTKKVLRSFGVSTVCEEARCPNQGACFSNKSASFMILGEICTRNCAFCAVDSGKPAPVDYEEPERVAEAAFALRLKFVVITSVTRDDLYEGGANQFAATIKALRKRDAEMKIEVLTPDFKGNIEALKTVLDARPEVFNHNIETVPRLWRMVSPGADYILSLTILKSAKRLYPDIRIKSGIMLGLGEKENEVLSVMGDLIDAGCDFLTIGQYLQPRKKNLPVHEYIIPDIFEEYKEKGLQMGFRAIASSPLTRSSMNAEYIYYNNMN